MAAEWQHTAIHEGIFVSGRQQWKKGNLGGPCILPVRTLSGNGIFLTCCVVLLSLPSQPGI